MLSLPVCLYLLVSPEKSKESPDLTGAVRPVKSRLFCLKTVACTQNVQAIVLYAADIGRRG